MSLYVAIRHVDETAIIELTGRISILQPLLVRLVEVLVERGDRYFVLDLERVSYVDSFGLGQLCGIYTVARSRGGDVKLLRPDARMKQLLRMTKLNTVFQSFEQECEAIASMRHQASCFSMSANG
jgi:anti-sigma B factor antagonist